MNLTRYSTNETLPKCIDWFPIITLGNEFSDEKSASILINGLVADGHPLNTIRITVYPRSGNSALCHYTATL